MDSAKCDHDHHHHHHHHYDDDSTKNIAIAFALNAGFALIEFIGGYFTHSVAIQADAVHDIGDSAALAGVLILQYVASSPPRSGFSYGFRRLSLLAASLTAGLLFVGSFFLISQALLRLQNPVTPHLDGMFVFALLGVAVNGYAAFRISRGHTQNEKAMAWHMMEDLMGWVAVLVSSIVMRFVDWPWLDPVLSIGIAGLVLVGAGRNLWYTMRLFLQAVPRGVSETQLRKDISSVEGVRTLTELRLWSLDGEHHVCTIQVEVASGASLADWERIKSGITEAVKHHGTFDVTIEPLFDV